MTHWTEKLNAYERLMRLDKPIGILLLLWPTAWGVLVASLGKPDIAMCIIFITGTLLMRSAGCVMNDIADRPFDGKVARTRGRPLVTGEVSVKEAYVLVVLLCLLAFGLVSFLNITTIYMSFLGVALAATYPLMKRYISIPQAYLGIAFGFGILMAFTAHLRYIPPVAWLLLAANIFWAVAYDTEYAMVDRADDLKIGVKSSAILFGRFDVAAIMACYFFALLWIAAAGSWLLMGWPFYLGLALAASVAIRHYFLIKDREPHKCFQAFMGNHWFGMAIFVGFAAEYLQRHYRWL